MDSTAPAKSSLGSVARTITKILRFRRSIASNTAKEFGPGQDDEFHKLKASKSLNNSSQQFSQHLPKCNDEKPRKEEGCSSKEATESLLADLFTSICVIKAAYAQLQVAQSPYDPDTIQYADQSVVTELKHLSELKHAYFKNQIRPPPPPPLAVQTQEHQNLIKTYQIARKKLESDIQYKGSEIVSLRAQLMESDRQNRSLESRLYPGHSLSSLDGLHLSGLDPTHFLATVQYTVRSIRSFVKLMIGEMESARWDLDAAARSIQPDVRGEPGHRIFSFESFVCQKLFSDFHRRDFGLLHLEDCDSWEPQQFFAEFTELKAANPRQFILNQKGRSSGFSKFCRAKYLTMVHPKMEGSFFNNFDQRSLVSSSDGFPESEFFSGFAEMARRVWLLHCLFFSFGKEMEGSIFQVKRGCRFSEVYMESVVEERDMDGVGTRLPATVGFTVVPGFRVGSTVIQCRVYLPRLDEERTILMHRSRPYDESNGQDSR